MQDDHQPIVLDKFNGLWERGNVDEVPRDHFSDCNNIRYVGSNSFATRYGIDIHQTVEVPLSNIIRAYNYPTPDGNTLIVLVKNDDDEGEIYHVVDSDTVYGPLLTIAGMDDFGFAPYAGRAYITPFASFVEGELNLEKGLEGEFLYVYLGDGTPARKAGGDTPAGTMVIANGAAGHTDPGLHVFGVVGETDTGYLSQPVALDDFTTSAASSVSFGSVPSFSGAHWTKRHIVSSKKINNYNGDTLGYQLFFIPNGTIENNTDLFINNVSFYDADLLEDASYLLDNFSEIPAGVGLGFYQGRMLLYTTFDDISLIYVSAPGEPEAFNQIDGLLIVPLDGNPITNLQELRDVLYVFKRAKTVAYVDNGDIPATWEPITIDNALGTCVHGIATVLDSGSASADTLIIANFQGIHLFNGRFISPELSWKIQDFWAAQNKSEFRRIQMVHDPSSQQILLVLPDHRILCGNFANGMNPKAMRWAPWSFYVTVNTIAIVNIDEIIIGANLE